MRKRGPGGRVAAAVIAVVAVAAVGRSALQEPLSPVSDPPVVEDSPLIVASDAPGGHSHPGPAPAPEGSVESVNTSVYDPIAGCEDGATVPLGQAPDAVDFEPLGSIWCFNLSEPPARTAVEGANSWVDDFTVDRLMLRLDDGDMGYRIFDRAGQSPGRSQHWINQNHWMVDAVGAFTGGSTMRPDRSFSFEDGKFVVEGDFAASIPEYGDTTWGEITITSAPAPTDVIADNLYAYGQFGGHWAVGCRLQGSRVPVCAVEGPRADSPPGDGRCSEIPGNYRVAELSFWQKCGDRSSGGGPWGEPGQRWRQCEPAGMDMACRDRFRMEVTKSSITLYVNGVKYFEDAGWPASHQLPDSFVNGDVYAYQSNWQVRAEDRAYRYHWDHFAVNPSTWPSASEWYCPDKPEKTCSMGG